MTARPTSRVAWPLGLLLLLAAGPAGAQDAPGAAPATPPGPLLLEGPASVGGLRTADADGDGVADLLLASGRGVGVWRGGALTAAPTWTFTLPAEVSYAWPGAPQVRGGTRTPTLWGLAPGRAVRLPPDAGAPLATIPFEFAWTDPRRAMLTDFVRGASLLLPTPTGWRWVPRPDDAPEVGFDLPARPVRRTEPAGPFLEDRAQVTTIWASPVVVWGDATAATRDAVWVVCDEGLRAFTQEEGRVATRTWRTDFLPADGLQRTALVDFDADGRPDLVHEATTNDSGTYAFFRTPAEAGGDLRPPRATLRLTGFQMVPDHVDLDGDGRPDFVVTTIDIDGTNVIAAVTRGRVTAKTRAFLNRSAQGEAWFRGVPDAEVASEIGVRILFSYAGAIEVRRSHTILTTLDLDRDGRKDLVIRTGDDRLTVRRGTAEGVWAREGYDLPIPPVGGSPDVEGYGGDLTGDGRDDVVLLYRAPPGGADRTVVVPGR